QRPISLLFSYTTLFRSDVDGDALLTLRAQAIGEQGEVHVLVAAVAAGALDGVPGVLEHGLRVVEQPPDQRALPVVDRAGGGEARSEEHTSELQSRENLV